MNNCHLKTLGALTVPVSRSYTSLIGFLLLVICTGCGTLGQCANPDVHFILPNAYVGQFDVVLDESSGVNVELDKGRYVYVIPREGQLRVRTLEPFLRCHKESAAYQNGNQIPDAYSNPPSDAIALRGGIGSGSRPVNGKNVGPTMLSFVIGSLADQKQIKLPKFTEQLSGPTPSP